MRRVLPLIVVAAAASGLTAAVLVGPGFAGGDDGRPEVAPAFDSEEARAARERFQACMREQGFELGPETELRITPDGATLNGKPVDRDALRAAMRECRPRLGRGLGGPFGRGEPDGEARERLDRIRECMEREGAPRRD
jgi:hypothetical protein